VLINLLFADTSGDVAFSFSSSSLFALLAGVSLDSGSNTSTSFVAASFTDTGLGSTGQTNSAGFSSSDIFALFGAAKSSFALFIGILDSVSAERGVGFGMRGSSGS